MCSCSSACGDVTGTVLSVSKMSGSVWALSLRPASKHRNYGDKGGNLQNDSLYTEIKTITNQSLILSGVIWWWKRKNFSIGTVWKKNEKSIRLSMCWSSMEWSSMIPRRRSITFPDFLKKDFFSLIFSSKPLRTTQGHHLRPSFAKMWLSS